MFDWLVVTFGDHPYPAVVLVFMLCGIGLPLPEELVLIAAGFVCFLGVADLRWMIATCVLAILLGDLIPFYLGRTYGARLLRIRWMRFIVSPHRLDAFDRWFRKRGDLVIFFARFIAGIRVVAYFIAGTMKMSWRRFLTLDLLGIALTTPVLVYVGFVSGNLIQDAIRRVQQAERGILIAVGVGLAGFGIWWWWRKRHLRRVSEGKVADSFVEASLPEIRATEPLAEDGGQPGSGVDDLGPEGEDPPIQPRPEPRQHPPA